ncbi:MAG TPA: hypothetical protein ENK55_01930 [Actinobacteria bacterium]|nr:hypothetical protein [Actinomycetota bacterium]
MGAVVAGLVSYPVMLWLAPVVGLAVLSTEHRRRRSVAGLAAVAFVTALLTALFVFAEASSLRLEVGG